MSTELETAHVFLTKRGGGRPDGQATCVVCDEAKGEGDHRELTQGEQEAAQVLYDALMSLF